MKSTPTLALWLCLTATLWVAAGTASAPLPARTTQDLNLPAASIHQMMKNVAWNELQASEHPVHYYWYLEKDISSDGSRTNVQIATHHGYVDRLIAVDGKSPNKVQIEKNEQVLQNLLTSAQLRESRYKDQRSDTLRRDNVIKDVPNAFVFTYDGRSKEGLVKLKFRPAPNFKPSSRQSLILRGMAGEVWVDPSSQRMAKIDGTLIKDVKIGWGFLARLNKGGRFLMEQTRGPDGIWQQELLSVHFDGSILIFKGLHIHETIIRSFFKQVPKNLTVREAVHMLQADKSLPKDWQSRLDAIEKSARFD
ncbi:MAG: hypothetical protein P8Z30_13095 [Acidobacteriota bacterium]